MSIARRFTVFSVLLASTLALPGQQSAAPQGEPTTLDVVVTPRDGAPVSGLQQSDFKVFDNKVQQAITSFEPEGGEKAPVEIVLLIDAVNATYITVGSERLQIDRFLQANGGRLAHPVTLAVFTESGTQIQQDFSTDGNQISASLDSLTVGMRNLRRSTGVYGAEERMNLSLKALQLVALHEAPRPGRKLVLWVSPGWPLLTGPGIQLSSKQQNSIYATAVGLSAMLQKGRITLYALDALGATESLMRSSYYQSFVKGLNKPQDATLGNLGLQIFATQTGGLVLNSNDLTVLLQRCAADADSWYQITYVRPPADRPGEYRPINVQVDKPGLIARTLTGYYSNPVLNNPGVPER